MDYRRLIQISGFHKNKLNCSMKSHKPILYVKTEDLLTMICAKNY